MPVQRLGDVRAGERRLRRVHELLGHRVAVCRAADRLAEGLEQDEADGDEEHEADEARRTAAVPATPPGRGGAGPPRPGRRTALSASGDSARPLLGDHGLGLRDLGLRSG